MANGSRGLERAPGEASDPCLPVAGEKAPVRPAPLEAPRRQSVTRVPDVVPVPMAARELDTAPDRGAAMGPLATPPGVQVVVRLMDPRRAELAARPAARGPREARVPRGRLLFVSEQHDVGVSDEA